MATDIHPRTKLAMLKRDLDERTLRRAFPIELVAAVTGMNRAFIGRVLGKRVVGVNLKEVLGLLDQDAFSETFVPRSMIPDYLLGRLERRAKTDPVLTGAHSLIHGDALELLGSIPTGSVQCVVTSSPYWGMRLYDRSFSRAWADGETCPYGNEQTPESFIRHTIEVLHTLRPCLTNTASVWWNLMDTFNTRTQIRGNAAETLRAMQGKDQRSWHEHACRRYSAGHSFLKDGEQCVIPAQVAHRASRIGYYVKSIITWKKNGSLPETVESRVTREQESILHLSVARAPLFYKGRFLTTNEALGGRNKRFEAEKLTDVWHFSTATGQDGHGAQFPVTFPARCIALTTNTNDLVLDPFVGSGTTSVAARLLNRRSMGFDISEKYLAIAKRRLTEPNKLLKLHSSNPQDEECAETNNAAHGEKNDA